jgi:hypothetical protein
VLIKSLNSEKIKASMKKFSFAILAFILITSCVPSKSKAQADNAQPSVTTSKAQADNAQLSVTALADDKTIDNPIYDSESDFVVQREGDGIMITGYAGSKTEVRIPPVIQNLPVIEIGDGAFWNCTSLTSITIPDSVIDIEYTNFYACTSLSAIKVDTGNTAYSSQDGVLYNKNKTLLHTYPAGKTVASFIIPNSVTSIGHGAFWNCAKLTSVTIPDSVTVIGKSAFASCESLISITIPDSVTSIEKGAFWNCKSLTGITIPDSITSIGWDAFHSCTSLISVIIPDSVTSIEFSVFEDCSKLTTVIIGKGVTEINGGAFLKCTSLTSVTFKSTIPPKQFSDGYVFPPGDLRAKYLKGGVGTYTRADGASETWTKQ